MLRYLSTTERKISAALEPSGAVPALGVQSSRSRKRGLRGHSSTLAAWFATTALGQHASFEAIRYDINSQVEHQGAATELPRWPSEMSSGTITARPSTRSSQDNELWDSTHASPLPCQSSQRHPKTSPLSLKPQMLLIGDVFLEIIAYQVAGNIEIIDY